MRKLKGGRQVSRAFHACTESRRKAGWNAYRNPQDRSTKKALRGRSFPQLSNEMHGSFSCKTRKEGNCDDDWKEGKIASPPTFIGLRIIKQQPKAMLKRTFPVSVIKVSSIITAQPCKHEQVFCFRDCRVVKEIIQRD